MWKDYFSFIGVMVGPVIFAILLAVGIWALGHRIEGLLKESTQKVETVKETSKFSVSNQKGGY